MKEVLLILVAIIVFPIAAAAQNVKTEAKVNSVPSVNYPKEAAKTGLEGQVVVLVDIDESGRVTKAYEPVGPGWVCPGVARPDVVSMRQAVLKAAMDSTFHPATEDGKPVSSQMSLTFKFVDPSPQKANQSGASARGYRITGNATPDSVSKIPEPSTATRETKTISGDVLSGSPSSIPGPVYPAAAKAVRASGKVDVRVVIDTNGTVFSAETVNGHPLLRNAARSAACKARFAPTLLSGEPVLVSGIITYNFVP